MLDIFKSAFCLTLATNPEKEKEKEKKGKRERLEVREMEAVIRWSSIGVSSSSSLSLSSCRILEHYRDLVGGTKNNRGSSLRSILGDKKRLAVNSTSTSHRMEPVRAASSQTSTQVELPAETLQKQFNCQGVSFTTGEGGLTKVVLSNESGSEAEIYLYGACVKSWKPSKENDLLYVRPDAVFNGQKPISGGIPHCFPQFGPGVMQQHGFARNLAWSVSGSENQFGCPCVILELKDNSYTRGMWDFGFLASYKVVLEPGKLTTELAIKNTDSKPFSFTGALHTYFRASAAEASVKGLKGCKTLNKDPDPKNPIPGVEERDLVKFPGFVDCVYLNAPSELELTNGLGDTILISNTNWPDAVVWNPYLTIPAAYKEFVCVENAQMDATTLQPGEEWKSQQILNVV